jgi:hypothetical protein
MLKTSSEKIKAKMEIIACNIQTISKCLTEKEGMGARQNGHHHVHIK